MLENVLAPAIIHLNTNKDTLFQQDGATSNYGSCEEAVCR